MEEFAVTATSRGSGFCVKDSELFSLAGIWRPTAETGDVYAFLTTEADKTVHAVHPNAMPVLLTEDTAAAWLEDGWEAAEGLARSFRDARTERLGDDRNSPNDFKLLKLVPTLGPTPVHTYKDTLVDRIGRCCL